ncbi:MAG TPA: hypothetical protein DCE44_16520 [Verrucomicrobiales bacterium]|nr:hypothetical protein [Verrucomicrobiales bacterium]
MGEVQITQVSNQGILKPVVPPASWRIVLHVDATGNVSLLKDAIIAARAGTDDFEPVVLTKPALLGALSLQRTNNAVLGQRLSTVAYDFTDNDATPDDFALRLAGTLGQAETCAGTLTLDKNHPTNPFRHKFHPDHAEGLSITRSFHLTFTSAIFETAGVYHIKANYEETLQGLVTFELKVSGEVTLTRVASTPSLNQ